MRLNSIQQQQRQNFKGNPVNWIANTVAKHPMIPIGLAGSSVVAQKIVMSGSEAVVGPVMDVGIGEVITQVTKEEDGRTRESSKVQAIRTFSQSVGGTIVGVIIRMICIGAATALCMKAGQKAGGAFADIIQKNTNNASLENKYLYKKDMETWGKNIGGAVATLVMLGTNFIIDAPFINWINKKATDIVDNKILKNKKDDVETKEKEVK